MSGYGFNWGEPAFSLSDRPGCFRLIPDAGTNGEWVGDPTIERNFFEKFIGNHCLLGLNTDSEIDAFHLLNNLFLTSQSRYAALRMGNNIKREIECAAPQEGLLELSRNLTDGVNHEDVLQIFGQFGLLGTREWLRTKGFWKLFNGCHLGR